MPCVYASVLLTTPIDAASYSPAYAASAYPTTNAAAYTAARAAVYATTYPTPNAAAYSTARAVTNPEPDIPRPIVRRDAHAAADVRCFIVSVRLMILAQFFCARSSAPAQAHYNDCIVRCAVP